MPKLSIGIPVVNGQEFLPELLDSLLAQNDSRIHYIHNGRNLGAVANFNRVFELSTAPLFMWVAHDDLYHEAYLEACVRLLEENLDIILAHTGTAFIDERSELLPFEQETGSFIDIKTGRWYRADVATIGDTPVALNRFWHVLTRARGGNHMFGVVRREILQLTSLLRGPWLWVAGAPASGLRSRTPG